jgi:peptidoglycan/LPS O-acetylase OafA/YrhL
MDHVERAAHLLYIDCLRGYAVLMVITCHLTFEFPELPYLVRRLTSSGWFGVQLFFLASCLTLLRSWHFEASNRPPDVRAFFIRRFFRIAPAYYTAAAFYFWLSPPPQGFDPWQAFTTATFINAWWPDWTPTVRGAWVVVPGGWSIGVEFSFYAVFPIFAAWVTSLRRSLAVFAASIVVGAVCNLTFRWAFEGNYTAEEISNFLFFWFPNQMSVFSFGGVLFFTLRDMSLPTWLRQRGTGLAIASTLLFGVLAYIPLGH